jgi:hypothetical protein
VIELHNQYKAYSSDGTIVTQSPVYEDKSVLNFVKGEAKYWKW